MKHHSLSSNTTEKTSPESQVLEVTAANGSGLNVLFDEGQYNSALVDNDLKPVTKTIQKVNRNKRRYINTPNRVRLDLIDAVHKHGEKIKYAAKRLGINYSSAKAICQVYRKEGRSDRIIVKRRESKQNSKALDLDKFIITRDLDHGVEENTLNRDEIYLKKPESLKEVSLSLLESKKSLYKEGSQIASGIEIQSIFKNMSNPAALYQSLQEAKQASHRINQIINQNNIFISVHPDYFPQVEKLNAMSANEYIPTGYQSICNQSPNLNAPPCNPYSVQSQHQLLLSGMINPLMHPLNLDLPQFMNYNHQPVITGLEKQFLQPYHDKFNQNNSCYPLSNLGMSPNLSMLNHLKIGAAQQQDYKLLSSTINKLPQSLNMDLSSVSTVAPSLNGNMSNTPSNHMFYYPK